MLKTTKMIRIVINVRLNPYKDAIAYRFIEQNNIV